MKLSEYIAIVLWVLIVIWVSGCAPAPSHNITTYARITFYCSKEDKYGSRIAMGGRAHEGTTLAAPQVIPFNTVVEIPGLRGVVGCCGHFVIQDRGSALEKAYRHGELRLDAYVKTRKRVHQLQYGEPEWMEVEFE